MSNAWSAVAGNARNGQSTFTSTWLTDDYEYAILVRHDWHPIVCQRTRNPIGSWVTHDVYDTVIGLIEVTDSHQGISIGVDPNGKVHISGNTHDTKVRHIQTTNAHDITSWVESPPIDKQARFVTNLVENGVVENNTTGWASSDGSLFTLDRVTHPYGWGSSNGNDLSCQALRLTRTATSPSAYIGIGTAISISGNGFPATAGVKYNTSLSFRAAMASPSTINHQMRINFRDSGNNIISYVDSDIQTAPDPTKWYRCHIEEAVAPANTTNIQIAFSTQLSSGNAATGDAMWVDGLMIYEGDAVGDIVYRDGAFNGGEQYTGWTWNGTAYASTSTGPIRSDGYAGINTSTYNRFQAFSDGSLLLSFANLTYVNNPVGRAWSAWIMEPGQTEFQPLVGEDGCVMRTVMSEVQQGSTYPILSTGNPADDDDIADRSYGYGIWVDKNDIIHLFCWFRVKTSTSYGSMLYVRSNDKGATWENVQGEAVTMPLTYPEALDTALVSTDGSTPINISTLGGVAEKDGNPMFVGTQSGNGQRLVYWNGTAWINESISSYSFVDNPSVAVIRGDIWLFGVKTVGGKGSRALWGVNHTQDTGPIVRLGAATIGTPDDVYTFESGATYEGAPTHAGGLDSAGNYVYKRLLPDNNSPKIVQLGGGVRGNTA